MTQRRIGRPCSCCASPHRDAIDEALADPNAVMPVLSRRFGVGENSLLRHRRDHLPSPTMRAALTAMATGEGLRALGLVEQVECLRDDASILRQEALSSGDRRAALHAQREMREAIALIAKLRGEIGADTVVNVAVIAADPGWLALRARLVAALAPYPEARQAVADAIEQQEAA